MRKSVVVLVLMLLCGCAPMMVSSKRAASYTGTIRTMAIVVEQIGKLEGTSSFGLYAVNADVRARGATFDLDRALNNRLAPYFSAKGIPSELVASAEAHPARFRHRLVITPLSRFASCSAMGCQAKVHVRATLQDASRKGFVWTGSFDVWEPSGFHKIDDATADKVGDLIWGVFQAEKLVGPAQ